MTQSTSKTIPYCFVDASVSPEDITCVHAALKAADPETLLCVLLETRLAWKLDPRTLAGSAKRHLLRKTESMLSLMYDIEPAPQQEPDQVLIPVQSFEYPGRGSSVKRIVSAGVLDLASFAQGSSTLDHAALISHVSHDPVRLAQLSSVDGLIGCPWADILGRTIWLPSALTSYERLSELAHIFWVMCFSGFAEAVFEMHAVSVREGSAQRGGSADVALCYDEYEQRMEAIVRLLNHNSLAQIEGVACALKRSLVA